MFRLLSEVMKMEFIASWFIFSFLGMLVYHGVCVVGKLFTKSDFNYEGLKGIRVCIAASLQVALCAIFVWNNSALGAHNNLMIGMAAAFLIDHGLKIVGVRKKAKK
jgi:hypothetical protein